MPRNYKYTNPVTFGQSTMRPGSVGSADYGAFMGLGRRESIAALRGMGNRRGATAAARMLGGIGRVSQPLSKTFNMMGKNVTYGRASLAGGLGLLALRNGANVMDRMRYGDYSGAIMSGAMTAAAGYGAYATYMYKGALRQHFNIRAAALLKYFR